MKLSTMQREDFEIPRLCRRRLFFRLSAINFAVPPCNVKGIPLLVCIWSK